MANVCVQIRYGGAYQLGSAAFQPLTGKIFRFFSIKVSQELTASIPGQPQQNTDQR